MKKFLSSIFLVLIVTLADAQFMPVKVSLYSTKQLQYRDYDGDQFGDQRITKSSRRPLDGYVLARIDGLFDCNDSSAALNPGATETCNFIDDDCNGTVDDGVPHYYFYTDANGDGYGDNTAVTAFCEATPPAGYTANEPVTADFTLTSTGHILNPLIWGFSGEHWLVNDKGVANDVLADPRLSNVAALLPQALSYSGTPEGHYTQYLPGDTIMSRPIGNGGFNPIPTSNKTVFYGKQFSISLFPEMVELCALTGAKLVIQTPPVINRDGWINALGYAKRNCGLAAVLMFQEYNGNYVDCPMCTNGTRVRDSANKVISITAPLFPEMKFTTDVGTNYANGYSQSNFQISGFTSSRLYYSESRSTGVRATATAQQLFDSMNVSIARFPQKCGDLIEANGGRGVAVTSWYSDGADPYGGQYVSNNTWLQAYYECSLAAIAFVNYDVSAPGKLEYCLYGRLERLGADRPDMNLKGKAFTVIAPALSAGLTVQRVTNSAATALIEMNGFTAADHHGYVIVINPTEATLQAQFVSDNGFIRPVTKIQVLKADSWLDTAPVLGQDDEVGAYSIARIEF